MFQNPVNYCFSKIKEIFPTDTWHMPTSFFCYQYPMWYAGDPLPQMNIWL